MIESARNMRKYVRKHYMIPIYIYIHRHIYIYIHRHIYIYIYTYINIYIYMYIDVHSIRHKGERERGKAGRNE